MNTILIDKKLVVEKVLYEKFNSKYIEDSCTEDGFSGKFTIEEDYNFEVLAGEDLLSDPETLLIVMNKKLGKNAQLEDQYDYLKLQVELELHKITEEIFAANINAMINNYKLVSKAPDLQCLMSNGYQVVFS